MKRALKPGEDEVYQAVIDEKIEKFSPMMKEASNIMRHGYWALIKKLVVG